MDYKLSVGFNKRKSS